ncbi:hypothetical protein KCU90_g252, partial [Aureobasidium melanogenum]
LDLHLNRQGQGHVGRHASLSLSSSALVFFLPLESGGVLSESEASRSMVGALDRSRGAGFSLRNLWFGLEKDLGDTTCGVPGKEDDESDGWTRLGRCNPADRLSRDVLVGSGGLEAGILGDWLSRLVEPRLSLVVGGREDCSPIRSLSLLRYFSFSLSVRSKSLLRPRIMALCFSTSLHNWVLRYSGLSGASSCDQCRNVGRLYRVHRDSALYGGRDRSVALSSGVSAAWEVRRRRVVSSGLVLKGGCPCRGLKGGELLRVGDGDDDGGGRSCAAFTAPWVRPSFNVSGVMPFPSQSLQVDTRRRSISLTFARRVLTSRVQGKDGRQQIALQRLINRSNPPRLNHRPCLTRPPKAVVFPVFRANLPQRITCRRALFSLSQTQSHLPEIVKPPPA